MKKDKLFDVIVYRFLLSIPVSCVANFVYGFILAWALFVWSKSFGTSLGNFERKVFVFLTSISATIPFILLNMVRYAAIKSGHLHYGLIGFALSAIPEYLFFISWILLVYTRSIL